jgi:hypothetical protein
MKDKEKTYKYIGIALITVGVVYIVFKQKINAIIYNKAYGK